MVAILQTPQLATVRLDEEKEAAAVCELVRLRLGLGVLDVEVRQGHWGYRPWGILKSPPILPPLWREATCRHEPLCAGKTAQVIECNDFLSCYETVWKCVMVPRGGIEPPTLRFSVACSTN